MNDKLKALSYGLGQNGDLFYTLPDPKDPEFLRVLGSILGKLPEEQFNTVLFYAIPERLSSAQREVHFKDLIAGPDNDPIRTESEQEILQVHRRNPKDPQIPEDFPGIEKNVLSISKEEILETEINFLFTEGEHRVYSITFPRGGTVTVRVWRGFNGFGGEVAPNDWNLDKASKNRILARVIKHHKKKGGIK